MQKAKSPSNNNSILIVVIVIFTFPIWIGILGGLFGLVVGGIGGFIGLIAGAIGIVIGTIGGLIGSIFNWGYGDFASWNFVSWNGNFIIFIAVVLFIALAIKPRR
jgi:hypothetical protein